MENYSGRVRKSTNKKILALSLEYRIHCDDLVQAKLGFFDLSEWVSLIKVPPTAKFIWRQGNIHGTRDPWVQGEWFIHYTTVAPFYLRQLNIVRQVVGGIPNIPFKGTKNYFR